jgi:hypothetical protein
MNSTQGISIETAMMILMHDDAFKNVEFECDHGVYVKACKQILAARSLYFKNLLLFDQEKDSEKKSIKMHGISGRALKCVVEFLHTDNVKDICESVQRALYESKDRADATIEKGIDDVYLELLELIALAKKFSLPKLEAFVEEKLVIISKHQKGLQYSVLHFLLSNDCDNAAMKIIEAVKKEVNSENAFIGFDERVLLFCLDTLLDVENADQILRSLVRWAKWKASKLEEGREETFGSLLEKVMQSIKYEYISPETMENFVGNYTFSWDFLSKVYLAQAKYQKSQVEIAKNSPLEMKVNDIILCRKDGVYHKALVTEISNERVKVVSFFTRQFSPKLNRSFRNFKIVQDLVGTIEAILRDSRYLLFLRPRLQIFFTQIILCPHMCRIFQDSAEDILAITKKCRNKPTMKKKMLKIKAIDRIKEFVLLYYKCDISINKYLLVIFI